MACELRVVNLPALIAAVEQRAIRRTWENYTANRLWELCAALYGNDYPVPNYTEIAQKMNGKAEPQPPKSTETAEEIYARFAKGMREIMEVEA